MLCLVGGGGGGARVPFAETRRTQEPLKIYDIQKKSVKLKSNLCGKKWFVGKKEILEQIKNK